MDNEMFIELLKIISYLILGGIALWFRENAKIKEKTSEMIAEAEDIYKDTVKAGGMKHQYVVEELYSLVPVYMRMIFTKETISGIVDRTFESIEQYGKMQLDKAVNKILIDKK